MNETFLPSVLELEQFLEKIGKNSSCAQKALQQYEQFFFNPKDPEWQFLSLREIDWRHLMQLPKPKSWFSDFGKENRQDYFLEHSPKISALFFCLARQHGVMRITKNRQHTKPFYLSSREFAAVSTLTIIVEEGAQATIIDLLDHAHYTLRAITIIVHNHARLTMMHEQQKVDQKQITYTTLTIHAHANSAVEDVWVCMQSGIMRSWINAILLDPEAFIDVRGLYSVEQQNSVQWTTRQEHRAAQTTSKIHMHGIVADKAQSLSTGTIFIDEQSTGSNAVQMSKAILKSNQARVVAIPSLEVLTHNVSCKHGSATDQITPQHILFMQSRGIDALKAKSLMQQAFLHQALEGISPFLYERARKRTLFL